MSNFFIFSDLLSAYFHLFIIFISNNYLLISSSVHYQGHMSLGIVFDSFQVSCMQWCPSGSSYQVCPNNFCCQAINTVIYDVQQTFCYVKRLSKFYRFAMFFHMTIR